MQLQQGWDLGRAHVQQGPFWVSAKEREEQGPYMDLGGERSRAAALGTDVVIPCQSRRDTFSSASTLILLEMGGFVPLS